MSLIKSISGIRGTIGGRPGDGLSPVDVVKFTSAFATFLLRSKNDGRLKMVVGRDARLSGDMVDRLVVASLVGMGVDVVETGLSTTPTTEMAVINHKADGGVIITASHNPMQWNDWYSPKLKADGRSINTKEYDELSESRRESYIEGPTFMLDTHGVYGQRDYKVGDIIPREVVANYEAIPPSYVPSNQATVVRAYVSTEEMDYLLGGNAYHVEKGADIPATDYSLLDAATKARFTEAFICTSTITIDETANEFVINGTLLSQDDIYAYKAAYARANGAASSDVDQLFSEHISEAYRCTTAGKYGGRYYEDTELLAVWRKGDKTMALVRNHEGKYIEYECDHFVNAMGWGAERFTDMLGIDTGLYPVKHQAFITRRLPLMGVNGDALDMIIDRRHYKGFSAVYGQQFAHTGQIIGCASPDTDAYETRQNIKYNSKEFLEIVCEVFAEWIPGLRDVSILACWAGRYTEPRYIVDPSVGLLTGLRGHGFMLGQYLAKLYVEKYLGHDVPSYMKDLALNGNGLSENAFK